MRKRGVCLEERFHIFCGHFGSGKSEVAVNFALRCRQESKNVSIVDLDIVNPYFRTNDAREILEEAGIEVIAPEFANSNLDMPTVPSDIMRVFNNPDKFVIFDVGGDEDGAYALGRYLEFFTREAYAMHLVVNLKRPLTETAEEICEMAAEIERASRLKVTDIVNNTNIGRLSTAAVLEESRTEIEKAAELLGVPISMYCAAEGTAEGISEDIKANLFQIDIKIKMPWER